MPRNVRNFWLRLEVDGKQTPVETGPRSKDGGFTLRVYMRQKGRVWEAANLVGYAESGTLRLVYVPDGKHTFGPVGDVQIETTR